MIGRLNHVAIAVPDIAAAAALYAGKLGAAVSAPSAQPEHGVTTVFIELPGTKVELIAPLGDESPIAGFLARNPQGRVPVLDIDGLRLTQSVAIIEYLDETRPGSRLLPSDAVGRVRVRALADAIAMDIEALHGNGVPYGGIAILVRDEGCGFDPAALPDPLAPENILKTNGRGIFLMRS